MKRLAIVFIGAVFWVPPPATVRYPTTGVNLGTADTKNERLQRLWQGLTKMGFLERIKTANTHDYQGLRPFCINGVRVGCVNDRLAETLQRWPEVFGVHPAALTLAPTLDTATCADRTQAIAEVLRILRDEEFINGWRDELYPVTQQWSAPPLALMERAAIPFFGVPAYGVHMSGYVRDDGEDKLWVARRSLTKPTGAGQLDQIVAGGQPHGIGLRDNMIKECWEEASIPRALAEQVRAVGTLSYTLRTELGFRPDVIFSFDLELPSDFVPRNTDGEVEAFYLWSIDHVTAVVRDTSEFKFNCALVVIDFLVRHGHLSADDPDYEQIVAGLHATSATPPAGWPN